MGKPHPVELRQRVVDFVEEGHSHRAAAAHFRVSVRFVNDMVILKRETGALSPKRQGHGGTNSKLRAHEDWLRRRLEENCELTLDELVCELSGRGADVHRSSVGRCHGLVAPWIIDRAMNRQIFEIYVGTQLAPTLSERDVVIMDNVAFHKSEAAEALIRERGAWVLFLPAYSPDLNPIERAFSKLKTLLRKHAARSFDAICKAAGDICDLFTPQECRNFFQAAGYELE